jgi:hypothetical protein
LLQGKAYEAGLKPTEFYELTLREVLQMIDAHDKRTMQFFNLNTRIIAWYSLVPHVERGKMPSFENFMTSNGEDINTIGEDLQARAAYMRKMLIQNGYLKEKN